MAVESTQVATDGGLIIDAGDDGEIVEDTEDACQNGQVNCPGPDGERMPCFPCYRDKNGVEKL
jgi:hypothetical protein